MTNKERYIQLCEKEDTICVYDQPWWLDAVCGEDNWDVLLYEKNGTVLGTLAYYVKNRMGIKYITQPPFTQHNGIWIKYADNQTGSKKISYEKEVFTNLIEQIENLSISYYLQAFSPTITNWLPFYWKGYKQTTCYTYRIPDIHDSEMLFGNFQHNKRKNINKAHKAGYTIKYDLSAKDFYEHHKKSLMKQGTTIHYSFDLFEKIYNAAYSKGCGRTIYVEDANGQLLCALFNIWDKRWGYDLISAIDPDTRNSGAPDLMVYHMINLLSEKVKGYDFEGSMLCGVEESFRHFGAEQTPYFVINKTFTKNPVIKSFIRWKMNR